MIFRATVLQNKRVKHDEDRGYGENLDRRDFSIDASLGICTLIVVGKTSFENSPRGGVISCVLYIRCTAASCRQENKTGRKK